MEVDSRQPTFVSLSNDINVANGCNVGGVAKIAKNISSPPSTILHKSISKRVSKNSFENKVKGGHDLQENEKRKLATKDVEKIIVKCLDVDNPDEVYKSKLTKQTGILNSHQNGNEITNDSNGNVNDLNDVQNQNQKEETEKLKESDDKEQQNGNEIDNSNFSSRNLTEKFSKLENENLILKNTELSSQEKKSEENYFEKKEPLNETSNNLLEQISTENLDHLQEQISNEKDDVNSLSFELKIVEEKKPELDQDLPDSALNPDEGKINFNYRVH